ncbi:hypothetical protein [Hymenobacter rigui]|uniref:Uncharacterized protein n=1 Tax=Hymenobacter rigui TaxID=334424 RepID=A0A3R9N401_9BACT|nr:hypothetical protein [Hymenobacter rigui]RSK47676.1 hypothetical protein EI291_13810 [Hymenobacter rigui]
MKYFSFLLFLLGLLTVSGCRNDDKDPYPELESLPVIFPSVTATKSFYDYNQVRSSANPVFEFTIDPGNQRDIQLASIEVYKTFRRGTSVEPRILYKTVSSFPATLTIPFSDVLQNLTRTVTTNGQTTQVPFQPNFFVQRDEIVFTFEYVLTDGRRIVLTPLDGGKIQGALANAPYAAVAVIRVP